MTRLSLTPPGKIRNWPHVLEMQQFTREHLEYLWGMANTINPLTDQVALEGKRVALLFGQPSTRTLTSFRVAAETLGAQVYENQNMLESSSLYKRESIEATMEMFLGYNRYHLYVLRLPHDWVNRAAAVSNVPIVNGGSGKLQHPTQAMLDGHAIMRRWGSLDGLKLMFVGDMDSRTGRSLAYLMSKFRDVQLTFVTDRGYAMGDDLKAHLTERGVSFREVFDIKPGDLAAIAAAHHGIYALRLQDDQAAEKLSDEEKWDICRPYCITQAVIDALPPNGFVHHPLPNTQFELPDELVKTNDSRRGGKVIAVEAAIHSGIRVRQAVLKYLLAEDVRP